MTKKSSDGSDGSDGMRWFAVGDPQTTKAKLFEVLARYDLLDDENERLRPDVGLVSMGDHFDFPGEPLDVVEREGRAILEWLASHSRDQVTILAGNHDLSRVMELAFETDASFAEARALKDEAEFARRFPRIPTIGIAARDYSSFSVAQRELVARLLLDRRMRIAATATVRGHEVLLTHAGVTKRELTMLEMADERSPSTLAAALDAWFHDAVDKVRARWTSLKNEPAALDLSPVHVMGTTGREGGGLLYHRPSRRDRPEIQDTDGDWAFDIQSPRRFEPTIELPRGLLQVAGHTGHKRCKKELTGWIDDSATVDHLAIRTLRLDADKPPRYTAGVDFEGADAAMVMIDPHFAGTPSAECELLPLDSAPI
jgi:hypothetical protein